MAVPNHAFLTLGPKVFFKNEELYSSAAILGNL